MWEPCGTVETEQVLDWLDATFLPARSDALLVETMGGYARAHGFKLVNARIEGYHLLTDKVQKLVV